MSRTSATFTLNTTIDQDDNNSGRTWQLLRRTGCAGVATLRRRPVSQHSQHLNCAGSISLEGAA